MLHPSEWEMLKRWVAQVRIWNSVKKIGKVTFGEQFGIIQ